MIIQFQKLDDRARVPVYGSAMAAGADLYGLLENPVTIQPGETVTVHTGIAAAIPEGCVGLIYARSGLASKRGLAPANCVGVIDPDYRGEIMVALHNYGTVPQTVEDMERIAQLVIAPFIHAEFQETSALDPTERGSGGFGSTGLK